MNTQFFSLENYPHSSIFEGIIYPWEPLLRLENYLSSYKGVSVDPRLFPGVFFQNSESIFVGDGVKIEPGAFIQGPCILEAGSIVRHGAYLRGGVIVGKSCVLGHGTEIKNSIFLNDVSAAHFNYVGNSILGNRVNLGAGVKCANFRLNRKEIHVIWNGEKIETGMRKLGAIIGDDCSIGCNCVISPGTLLEPGVKMLPLMHVRGCVSSKNSAIG